MSPQKEIAQAFREVLDEMNLTPFEATKGPCRTVAERVDEKIDRDLRLLCSADVTGRTHRWHEWIFDPATGCHHDAEASRGVEQWQDLPFFGGWRADRSGPPDGPEGSEGGADSAFGGQHGREAAPKRPGETLPDGTPPGGIPPEGGQKGGQSSDPDNPESGAR